MITPQLIQAIRQGYPLPWRGIHGVAHWARVLENGLRLAEITGASTPVVSLFAVFHDSRRVNEHLDRDHGLRGAEFARALRGRAFELGDEEFELLRYACAHHTDGLTEGDITVQTCWDADRLDLGRAGIVPAPERLCTEAARDRRILDWAHRRSITGHEPERVRLEWHPPDGAALDAADPGTAFDLQRFVSAQEPVYHRVLAELRNGRKSSHWMWFIFPQVEGLGHSPAARHYAIRSLAEARAFLSHPVLGPRLVECARLTAAIEGRPVSAIFDYPDDLKFRSSLTLFARAAAEPGAELFRSLLTKYFDGQADARTLEILDKLERGGD